MDRSRLSLVMVRLVFERGDAGGEDGDQPLLGFDGLLQVVELVQQLFQDQRQVLDPLRLGWWLLVSDWLVLDT